MEEIFLPREKNVLAFPVVAQGLRGNVLFRQYRVIHV